MDPADRHTRIERLYELALGRRPEPGADLSGFMAASPDALAGIFFGSPEFHQRVAGAFAQGGAPRDEAFDYPPSAELKTWAVTAFSTPPDITVEVTGAGSWAQLYRALFTADGHVRLGLERRPFDDAAWAGVLALAEGDGRPPLQGAVDFIAPDRVAGWAVDPAEPGRAIAVELWIEGRFAAAGVTGGFRRDIEERFPGAVAAGYSLPIPPGVVRPGRVLRLEIREAGRPAAIGVGEIHDTAPAERLVYETVRRELSAVREAVARLEARLPAIEHVLTHRAEDWSGYFDVWYRPAHQAIRDAIPHASSPGTLRVRIDADGCRAPWVIEAVESALEQSRAPAGVFVVGLDAQARLLLEDYISRRGWVGGQTPQVHIGEPPAGGGPVLGFPAAGLLSPDAVEAVEALFAARPEAAVVYVDEDVLAAEAEAPGDWRTRPHGSPSLKPGFDPDFARQSPWIGDCLAFAGDLVPGGARTVLAAAEAGAKVASIPRLLFSRRAEAVGAPDTEAWAEAVRAHLARTGEAAEVGPANDVLGADAPGAVRVRHRVKDGATATVVIPTRDRLDLLRPCLDSLEARRGANRCAMRVVVIDHLSREAETRALLMERQAAGQIEVLPYDGTFNWALMNNLAADRSEDDVLVFLNNDTLAISDDWLDCLVAQALRPVIGVVGARLVYQDGALQHAGMVARPRAEAFLIHEGMGLPGTDPGSLGRHALSHRCVAVTGACMAVSRQVFRQLGGFDAVRLPVEGNDVDLCLKARAEGLEVIYEPGATLYHLESRSRGLSQDGDRLRASMEATREIWRRWGERFSNDPGFNPHFARDGRPFERLRPPPLIRT